MFFLLPLLFSFNWFYPVILLFIHYYFYEFNNLLNLNIFLNETQFYLIFQSFFINPIIQYSFFFFNFLIFSNFGFFLNFLIFIPIDLINHNNLEPLNLPQNLLNGLVLIHPPILFFGYNSFFFFFLFKFSLILFYKSDWIKFISYLIIKSFLLALILGGWWAANELNWGGWWSWDIVELGALTAFFISILFIHLPKNFLIFIRYLYLIFLFFILFYNALHWGLLQSVHSFIDVNSIQFSYLSFIYIFIFLFIPININKKNILILFNNFIIFILFYFIFINFIGINKNNYKFIFFLIIIPFFIFSRTFNFNYIPILFPIFLNFFNFINFFKFKFNPFHIFFFISFNSIFFLSLGLLQKNIQINPTTISFFLKNNNIMFFSYLIDNNFFLFNINDFFFIQNDFLFYNPYDNINTYYMNSSYENQIIKNNNLFNFFYIKNVELLLFDPSFILIFINF